MPLLLLTGAAAAQGLCAAGETVFLACQVAGKDGAGNTARWINLCGNPPQSLQYRFGRAGKIELQYPPDAAHGVQKFWFAHYMRLQTDRVEIRFRQRGTEYILFDYLEEGNQRQTGVRITTPGGSEHELSCADHVTTRLRDLKPVLRCDADSALNLGGCP